ncbi:MAG: translation initiation factor IF-2 [Planctomycetota bacterium]
MAEKMRVHILAKELNVPSKTIIDKCRAEGIDSVKNHMSTLSAGLHATIKEWFSEGRHSTALETAQPIDLGKVRIPHKKRRTATAEGAGGDDDVDVEAAATGTATMEAPPPTTVAAEPDLAPHDADEAAEEAVEEVAEEVAEEAAEPVAWAPMAPMPPMAGPPPVEVVAERPVVSAPLTEPHAPFAVVAEAPTAPTEKPVPAEAPPRPSKAITPAGPQNVPAAAKLQGPRVVRYEAPDYDARPPRRGPAVPRTDAPSPFVAGGPRPLPPLDPARVAEKDAAKRHGRFNPRRAEGNLMQSGEQLAEWRDRDLAERKERLAGATGRKIHRRRGVSGGPGAAVPSGPKTKATVNEPVRMKDFCAATGLNFIQLFKVLRDEHKILGNVNMTLPTDTAQLLALNYGIELEVIPARTGLDELEEAFSQRERKHLQPRPPVVTMLGHVDHGKTSLLDAIRKTRVVAGEDGGITQHIGAYHLQTSHGAVTFLDTPGHEAFTAMRSRGAQMTDVVVLVVAADDGIMPQTVEAIRHAQAAKVPIVVALNKIDLGDQNKLQIYGQLTEHGLTPSGDWGGEVDVIPTSATMGLGVKELIEHLADLSSLLELRADPTLPAVGTVIEAEMKEGVGAVVRLLVQDGTLRVGDFAVCGNAFGKVRALLDDCGGRQTSAGPGIPVEVWGLDEPPVAGDKLYVVDSLQLAKEIADQAKRLRVETGRLQSRKVKTLEEMFKQRDADEVPELNVIIKADVDGSIAALKASLADIPSDEVRLTIRHAAVGAVNDSDILLAATCRGIIVGFRVEPSVGARRLAEQHGVEVRPYRIIYDVVDDIRKALSGMLAPEERIESRATAEVRQVFRVSKVGLVAGCYVTSGTVERSHIAKIVRDGVVVRDGCKLASLRHLKDDVREVRAGMECGVRVDGFEDVHVGDVIETYEIVKIARSL